MTSTSAIIGVLHQESKLHEMSSSAQQQLSNEELWKVVHPINPKGQTVLQRIEQGILFGFLSLLTGPAFGCLFLFKRDSVLKIWRSIQQQPHVQTAQEQRHDPDKLEILTKALQLPSVRRYASGQGLDYQLYEGHCAVATQRCLLKSIPGVTDIPQFPANGGPKSAHEFANALYARGLAVTTIYGDEGFGTFQKALERCNDPNVRLAVNFLRGALFGIPAPKWLPFSWLLGFVSGHFSPIIGYLKEEQQVVVFDVNHKYGLFLVDAKRMYDAVNTVDIMSNKTRALFVVETND